MSLSVLTRLSRGAATARSVLLAERDLVAQARQEGYTWQQIADAVGTSRPNLIRMYGTNGVGRREQRKLDVSTGA